MSIYSKPPHGFDLKLFYAKRYLRILDPTKKYFVLNFLIFNTRLPSVPSARSIPFFYKNCQTQEITKLSLRKSITNKSSTSQLFSHLQFQKYCTPTLHKTIYGNICAKNQMIFKDFFGRSFLKFNSFSFVLPTLFHSFAIIVFFPIFCFQ